MKHSIIFTVTFLFVSVVRAEDVTQFRGPGGLGVSKETNLSLLK